MPPSANPSILVPMKRPARSKTRFEPPLKPVERVCLSQSLYEQTLSRLSKLRDKYTIGVVTDTSSIKDRAKQKGFVVISENESWDSLGQIVDSAIRLTDRLTGGVLVLPADLPLLTKPRLANFLDFCEGHSLVMNPDQKKRGTNALWRNPSDIIDCQYSGTVSFDAHLAACREQGIDPTVTDKSWLANDLDSMDDLSWLKDRVHELSGELRSTVSRLFNFETLVSPQNRG